MTVRHGTFDFKHYSKSTLQVLTKVFLEIYLLNKMNILTNNNLQNIINLPDRELINYLQGVNLLKRIYRCRSRGCRRQCVIIHKNGASLNHSFYCSRCRKFYSILTKSFFSKMNVPVRDTLHLFWLWSCEVRTSCAAMYTGFTKKCIVQIYRYIRDILSWKLLQEPDNFMLGKRIFVSFVPFIIFLHNFRRCGTLCSNR